MLPAGWTPVAAVNIAPHALTISGVARVSVSSQVAALASLTAVLARWDGSAMAWRAVQLAALPDQPGALLEADIQAGGQYAWLVPDSVPVSPALPAVGELLPGVPASTIPASAVTGVNPQPKIVVYRPGIRSDVRGNVVLSSALSSGTLVLAKISETYVAGAAESQPEPFVQDLVLYQAAPDGLSLEAAFPVTPSLTFDTLTFERGTITVELQAPEADGRDLAMIGPEGGAVSAATGERLEIPAGAAAASVTAHLERLTAAEIGLTLPPGLELLGAVSVNLSGAALAAPAALSIARPLHIAESTGLLLARLQLV